MNTQQQAYIEGFVKRASEYGLTQNEAFELLKSSGFMDTVKEKANNAMNTVYNKLSGANTTAARLTGDPLQKNIDNPQFNAAVKQNYSAK
jgi:hypothetical protein